MAVRTERPQRAVRGPEKEEVRMLLSRVLVAAAALAVSVVPLSPALSAVHVVNVQSLSSSPKDISINVGDTVRWVWVAGIHTTTSGADCDPDGLWDAVISSSDPVFERVFDEEGLYDYYCTPHCLMGMVGTVTVTGSGAVEPNGPGVAVARALEAGPNPFLPGSPVTVSFDLAEAGPVRVAIFDAAGRQVALLADRELAAGRHQVQWNGESDRGESLPSGIYYARSWSSRGPASAVLVKIR